MEETKTTTVNNTNTGAPRRTFGARGGSGDSQRSFGPRGAGRRTLRDGD